MPNIEQPVVFNTVLIWTYAASVEALTPATCCAKMKNKEGACVLYCCPPPTFPALSSCCCLSASDWPLLWSSRCIVPLKAHRLSCTFLGSPVSQPAHDMAQDLTAALPQTVFWRSVPVWRFLFSSSVSRHLIHAHTKVKLYVIYLFIHVWFFCWTFLSLSTQRKTMMRCFACVGVCMWLC